MFAMYCSTEKPPWSFMPSSTETTVGFHAATSQSNRASTLGIVSPPTPELRKPELQLRIAGEAKGLEVVRVQVLGGDAVAGHDPGIAVLQREIPHEGLAMLCQDAKKQGDNELRGRML